MGLSPTQAKEMNVSNQQVTIVMDWGGTWVRTALVTRQGEFLWQSRHPNPTAGTKAEYLKVASDLLHAAREEARGEVVGIGVAVAGPLEINTGKLYQPPNLMVLDGVSLSSLWEKTFDCPVWTGNDATLAALGEFHFGAGKDTNKPVRTLFYMTVSTGIGGGLVDRGSAFLGAAGLAGEVGHMTVDPTDSAAICQCGNTGCLEAISSGTAIAKTASEWLAEGRFSGSILAKAKKVKVGKPEITSRTVFEAAAKGDALAEHVVQRAVQALTIGLNNVVHLINPDMIVLGGGVTVGLVESGLLSEIHEGVRSRAMSDLHKEFQLLPTQLGDSVGLVGAAAMVWNQLETSST